MLNDENNGCQENRGVWDIGKRRNRVNIFDSENSEDGIANKRNKWEWTYNNNSKAKISVSMSLV